MKKITFLCALVFTAISVSAQTNEGFSTHAGNKTTFVNDGFWSHWFIGAGAGANIYFGDKDAQADFWNRLTVTPNFQFGTWFNPYLGARVKLGGGMNIHTFNNEAATMSRQRYVSAEAHMLWNVTEYIMPYSQKRVYSFIPYVGAGWAYTWDFKSDHPMTKNHVNSATLDAGIINRFHLNDRISLDIEFSGKLLRDEFDGRTGGKIGYDALGSASASLVVALGKTAFSEAVLRDPVEIDNLNRRINEQRAEINTLNQQLAVKPEAEVIVKEVVKTVETAQKPVNNVVLFPINGTKIQSHQEVNVYNAVKYMRENAESKLRIVGYTDKQTGTPAINEKLSRQRAQNVADLITGKYGISKDRVNVEWVGMTEPPFDTPEWNRAVILYLD